MPELEDLLKNYSTYTEYYAKCTKLFEDVSKKLSYEEFCMFCEDIKESLSSNKKIYFQILKEQRRAKGVNITV